MRVAGNDPGVVGILDVLHEDSWIVVYERIQFFASQQERSHHAAFVYCLVGAVYHPCLDEPHEAVREHFRMKAKVLVSRQLGCQGVRQGAYSHLDAVSVLHQGGTVAAYYLLCGRRHGEVLCDKRGVILYQIVETAYVDEVSVSERHVGIDHRDAQFRALDGCYGAVHGGSERHVSVFVRKRDLNQGSSQLDHAVAV